MRACACGHSFPDGLGRYGCPNCLGNATHTPVRTAHMNTNDSKLAAALRAIIASVDVLAVMDRAIDDPNTAPRHAMPLREARAAVAELIAAISP